ncbi:MAG TPA: PadR family transcriptional regulator [Jatrophihabitans sp.]
MRHHNHHQGHTPEQRELVERQYRRGRGDFGGRGDFSGFGGRGHHPHDHSHGGGRLRRGDMRGLLLAGLLDGPAHGYELMGRLEERSGGSWRPSPGSVYPHLQALEDEGLVRSSEQDGRKTYELTEDGRAQADAGKLDELNSEGEGSSRRQLAIEMRQFALAAKAAFTGSPESVDEAITIIRGARQALYRLLADQ